MPQIDCICGIFALHGIILHQGKGFVKGFSGFFLQKGKIRRNIKKLPKKRFRFLCILPAWFRQRIRRLCRREKMLAKQATYSREAWRIYTRFACTGRRPDAPYLYTQSVCAACFASFIRRLCRRFVRPKGRTKQSEDRHENRACPHFHLTHKAMSRSYREAGQP